MTLVVKNEFHLFSHSAKKLPVLVEGGFGILKGWYDYKKCLADFSKPRRNGF